MAFGSIKATGDLTELFCGSVGGKRLTGMDERELVATPPRGTHPTDNYRYRCWKTSPGKTPRAMCS